jgi:mRNA interferase MazF
MKRGELYLVRKPGTRDPRKQRVFIVVSRQALVDSRFSSVICAPVYSQHDELSTQVNVGPEEGLKRDSSIHCDDLVSLPKALLTHYVGSRSAAGFGNSMLHWRSPLDLKTSRFPLEAPSRP